MIPWFGVGTNYSPTGNSLEGMQTPEFAATTGSSMILLFLPSLSVTNTSPRPILCRPLRPHICLPDLLHPNQRLPLPRPLTAGDYLCPILGNILPDGRGQSCSCSYSPKGISNSNVLTTRMISDFLDRLRVVSTLLCVYQFGGFSLRRSSRLLISR